ncbi:MAG: 50S ribosomal protein L25 [Bacillota bacterium]
MAESTLKASVREPGSPRQLRREGYIPMVLYGRDVPNLHLKVDKPSLTAFMAAGGHRGLLDLEIEGADVPGDKERKVMIREIQREPLGHGVLHMDLYQVDMSEKITTEAWVRIHGEDVIDLGEGILQMGLRTLSVECLPSDIPEYIDVDVSKLEIGDTITVGELTPPAGVEFMNDPDEVVAGIVVATEEPEEEEEELEEELLDLEEGEELEDEEDEEDEEEDA